MEKEKDIFENFKEKFKDFSFNKISSEDGKNQSIQLYAKTENGHEVIDFVREVAKIYPLKFMKCYIIYEILDRLSSLTKDFVKTNIYRTFFVSNISNTISPVIENFIEDKGEIYHPTDPYNLEFYSTKILVTELEADTNYKKVSETTEIVSGSGRCYSIIEVKTLKHAAFYLKYGPRTAEVKRYKKPVFLKRNNLSSWLEFFKLPLLEQIKIINSSKINKGSVFDRKIVFVDEQELQKTEMIFDKDKMYITYKDSLRLIVPTRISNRRLDQRQIKTRNFTDLEHNILIFYDVEWNWKDGEPAQNDEKTTVEGVVKHPDYLTYTIVYGSEIVLKGYDKVNYIGKSGSFSGKDCMKKFLEMIIKHFGYNRRGRRVRTYCIAHNASNIEHQFVLTTIAEVLSREYKNYEIKFNHVSGTAVHSFYWKDIAFLDSLLFMQGSLAKISKSLNKKYHKISIEEDELLSIDWSNPSEEAKKYAMYDSLSLAEAWVNFNMIINDVVQEFYPYIHNLSLTNFRSGASFMKWFLVNSVAISGEIQKLEGFGEPYQGHKYEEDDGAETPTIMWDTEDISAMRDLVFHGGRCECGYLGTSEDFIRDQVLSTHKKSKGMPYDSSTASSAFAINIDITSSYPNVMATNPVPGIIYSKGTFDNKEELDEILKKYKNEGKIVYIYSRIKYKESSELPLLGIKLDKKLVFPNFMEGKLSVSYWDFEYEAIKDNVESVLDGDYIAFIPHFGFNDKVGKLYTMRSEATKNGDEALSLVLKILMNSGYGSLALNSYREVSYLVKGAPVDKVLRNNKLGLVQEGPGGFTWVTVKKHVEVNSILFAAAYITATARFNLWSEGMRLLNEEGAFLLYRDTDSHMFVDELSKIEYYRKKYPKNGVLGGWVLDNSYDTWEIAGLKVYRKGDIVRYKGVTGTKEELTGEDGLIRKTLTNTIWTRGRDGEIRVKRVTKRMSFKYTKGDVGIGGKGIVTPLIV